MKHRSIYAFGLALLAMVFAGSLAAEAVTLEGDFVWNREDGERTGDLKAVFAPTGEEAWDVTFYFDWEDEPRVYTGTATGSLSAGELKGDVEGDDPDHKLYFKFQGTFVDGAFSGTHGFVGKDGNVKDAGSLTLKHTD